MAFEAQPWQDLPTILSNQDPISRESEDMSSYQINATIRGAGVANYVHVHWFGADSDSMLSCSDSHLFTPSSSSPAASLSCRSALVWSYVVVVDALTVQSRVAVLECSHDFRSLL